MIYILFSVAIVIALLMAVWIYGNILFRRDDRLLRKKEADPNDEFYEDISKQSIQ